MGQTKTLSQRWTGLPKTVLGIDPGRRGAMALVNVATFQLTAIRHLPMSDRMLDVKSFLECIDGLRPDQIFIERGGARRHWNGFSIGVTWGALTGALSARGIDYQVVAPASWKCRFHLTSEKDPSRELAVRLWPDWHCERRRKSALFRRHVNLRP